MGEPTDKNVPLRSVCEYQASIHTFGEVFPLFAGGLYHEEAVFFFVFFFDGNLLQDFLDAVCGFLARKFVFADIRTETLRSVYILELARPGVGRFCGDAGWDSRHILLDGRQQVRGFLLPRNSIRLCCIFLCVLCALLRWWISRCRHAPRHCLCFPELSALFCLLPYRNLPPFENLVGPQALCGPVLRKNLVCSRCCRFRIHIPPGIFRKRVVHRATPPEGLRIHRISPQNTRQSFFADGSLPIFFLHCRMCLSRFSQLLRVLCYFPDFQSRPCAQWPSACILVFPGLFPKRWRYLPPPVLPPLLPTCAREFPFPEDTLLSRKISIYEYIVYERWETLQRAQICATKVSCQIVYFGNVGQ